MGWRLWLASGDERRDKARVERAGGDEEGMSRTLWLHMCAKAAPSSKPLTHASVAPALWELLEKAFPAASAAVLMTLHLHVNSPFESFDEGRRTLAAMLSGTTRSKELGRLLTWEPSPAPQIVTTPQIHRRTDRYIILNPNRAGLVDDPLLWPWSTHRDVVGAVARPWVEPSYLARLHQEEAHGFASRWHRYATRADGVSAAASSPLIRPASQLQSTSLVSLVSATLAATRSGVGALRTKSKARAIFLSLAQRHGLVDGTVLRLVCGVSPTTISRHRRRPPPDGLAAAELCLAEPRLRRHLEPEVDRWLAEVLRQGRGATKVA